MSNYTKCPNCGADKKSEAGNTITFECESEIVTTLGRFWYESNECKERKADIIENERDQLRAQLEAVTKERDELREHLKGTMEAGGFDYFQKRAEESDKAAHNAHWVAQQAIKERDQARITWHTAESELWLGELRERIATLTDQRDRAMALCKEAVKCDNEIIGDEWCMGPAFQYSVESLEEEITKEKEAQG